MTGKQLGERSATSRPVVRAPYGPNEGQIVLADCFIDTGGLTVRQDMILRVMANACASTLGLINDPETIERRFGYATILTNQVLELLAKEGC